MESNEGKARQYINEAEGKLKKPNFLNRLMGGGSGNVEEAISLFERAGNCYKMDKKWQDAGNCFVRAAALHLDNGVKHEGASKYVEAANCFRKVNPKDAILNLFKAIDIYTEMGKFNMAAKHHMTAGEIYEEDLADVEKSSSQFQKAADYFMGENSSSQANKCLLKVAEIAMQLEQFEEAIKIYEEIGRKAMDNKLLQYGAKEYFYKSVICMLCIDLVNGQKGIAKYEDMYPSFTDSREYKLLKELITCIESENADGYSVAIKEYDSISRIEPRLTKLFLKIKKLYLNVEEKGDEDCKAEEDIN